MLVFHQKRHDEDYRPPRNYRRHVWREWAFLAVVFAVFAVLVWWLMQRLISLFL